ncbi:4Fe-4S ferredoxin [Methanocella sp. CWC-04]|uniref:4Fe-4S ferredoxin n=1 Tax=Methanooceanicella nereidis TaxID=2052831 RepID=A0AAP2RD16_9EURY|nr:mercury methylation ferredoxin HgcB [Methanocella sp. CWC-04]MCD1293770.1 4Fe-4S ferredoxin [Methanocella sp. CWC-04]
MESLSIINTLHFDELLCINCGMCSIVCPHGVFSRGERKAVPVSPDSCMECGACQLNCPVDAIVVDSGVGCASAMIKAALTGSKKVTCGCDDDECEAEEAPCCCCEK